MQSKKVEVYIPEILNTREPYHKHLKQFLPACANLYLLKAMVDVQCIIEAEL